MIRLSHSLSAWGHPEFEAVLKQEVGQLGAGQLPLQQGLSTSSYALDEDIETMLISAVEEPGLLRVKLGIFYAGILAGCSCADDPTPVEQESEYCVVQLEIDKSTAATTVTLLAE